MIQHFYILEYRRTCLFSKVLIMSNESAKNIRLRSIEIYMSVKIVRDILRCNRINEDNDIRRVMSLTRIDCSQGYLDEKMMFGVRFD